MDQISRPLQVVLGLTLAFAALWFVALRPKAEEDTTPAAATTQATSAIPGGLGGAVDTAREAQRQADAAAAQRPGQADTAAGDPSAPGAPGASGGTPPVRAAPGPPVRGRPGRDFATPARVEAALAARKAVVLLFYSARSSDDRAVRREVAGVRRRGGRVVVMAASIRGVSRFNAITRGVPILQSPTVVVIGPSRRARARSGFVDRTEIDQLVAAALAGR